MPNYTRKKWVDGEKITENELNRIESNIEDTRALLTLKEVDLLSYKILNGKYIEIENSIDGILQKIKIEGRTIYKKNGMFLDTLEVGCSVISVGDSQTDNTYKIPIISENLKSNIKDISNIYLKEPLREMFESKDVLENGKVTRRVKMTTLNGSENWNRAANYENTIRFTLVNEDLKQKEINDITIASPDIVVNIPANAANDVEQITQRKEGINLNILKSKLEREDSVGIKQYLEKNNIRVYSPIEPIEEPLSRCIVIPTYNNSTRIYADTEVTPNLTINSLVKINV